MEIDEAVIDRSAEEGARCVALALLAEADDAARRLAAGDDEEALHDFRVALRRTRSTVRAFRPWLTGSVGRKMERRLRKLARATNAARDAEVALPWIAEQRHALGNRQRLAIDYLSARLEARRAAWSHEQRDVLARYARASRKLVERLQTYRARVEASARPTSYGSALASGVAEHLAAMREHVKAIAGSGDEEHVHRARIEGKKLRYLLEPVRGNRHADAQQVVKSLKQLQDVLGDLHDAHVLAGELGDALAEAAAERARRIHAAVLAPGGSGASRRSELQASPRPGLLTLARLVRRRRDALFGTLERAWRSGELDALAGEVRAVADALEGPGAAVATRSRSVTLLAAARRAPARRTRRRSPPGGRQARAAPLDRPPGERSTDASGRATTVRARGHGIRRRLSL